MGGIAPGLNCPGWLTAGERRGPCRPDDTLEFSGLRRLSGRPSSDDVGGELVFDLDDAVPQMQLALLQPLDLEEVGSG
jgi:hypothetical protein